MPWTRGLTTSSGTRFVRAILPLSALLTSLQRTFDEMSQHASLSPSPFFFGHPMPSGPLDNPPNFFERRRTSHPHNQASQSSYISQESMPEPRALQRPSLEHRTSQTIIDLTDDAGEPSMGGIHARYMSRPPGLDRSDAIALEDIIDLTNDVIDDELEIIDARRIPEPQSALQASNRHRQLPQPQARLGHRQPRDDSPSMFVSRDDPRPIPREREQHHHRHYIHHDNPFDRLVGLAGHVAGLLGHRVPDQAPVHLYLYGGDQQMPNLDYQAQAFVRQRQPPKPPHQAPPPARPGFTRSPTEDDVVVCPACGNELIAIKAGDDGPPIKKPHGKSPNKKEREEHHFWVVKECGHVSISNKFHSRDSSNKYRSTATNAIKAGEGIGRSLLKISTKSPLRQEG